MTGLVTLTARTKLTLWYAAMLAIMAAASSAVVYLVVGAQLEQQLQDRIGQSLALLEKTVREQPGELAELDEHVAIRFFKVEGPPRVAWESSSWKGVRLDGALTEAAPALPFVRGMAGNRPFRVGSRSFDLDGSAIRVSVAEEETAMRQGLRTLLLTLGLGLPVLVALGVVAGRVLAGRVLSPLGTMAKKAHELTAERLSERLPIANPSDEFGQLALAFNSALGRIGESFDRLRRFTADASHELRTPLTTLRSVGEVGVQEGATEEQLREAIGSMLEEVSRLTRLVDGLLTLTRAESGRFPLSHESVAVGEVVREVADYLRILAEEKSQTLSLEIVGPAVAWADRTTLSQTLVNIVENAIKYTRPGGRIDLRVGATGSDVVVDVTDNGPGISADDRPHIFERFYRGEPALPGVARGAGLGLAIAKWAVNLNHGRIEVESQPGMGATFRVFLPARLDPSESVMDRKETT